MVLLLSVVEEFTAEFAEVSFGILSGLSGLCGLYLL